jgi:hypothetical protein
MNQPQTPHVQLNLPQINLTAELQKVRLSNSLTSDQHADLRLLILDAAAEIGFDGNGRDGLVGYLKYAASTFPKQYMALISKVLPLQIDSKSTVNVIEHVNIVSVPPDRYVTADSFPSSSSTPDRAFTIEHEPTPAPESVQTIEDLLNNPTPVAL